MATPQQELSSRCTTEPTVYLYEIDLNPIGIPVIDYFSSSDNPEIDSGAQLDGRFYRAWPIKGKNFEAKTKGSLERPTIEAANIKNSLGALILIYSPRGALVRRRRIYRKHLDDGSDPNPLAQFPPQEYVIDNWDRNDIAVVLKLVTDLEYLNLEVPARRVIDLREGE